MKRSYVLGVALSGLLAAPAMAGEDFHALSEVSSLTPMAEEQLAAIEGGNPCSANFSFQFIVAQTCANVAIVNQVNVAEYAYNQSNLSVIDQNISGP